MELTEERKFNIFLVIVSFVLAIISGAAGGIIIHWVTSDNTPNLILTYSGSDYEKMNFVISNLDDVAEHSIIIGYKMTFEDGYHILENIDFLDKGSEEIEIPFRELRDKAIRYVENYSLEKFEGHKMGEEFNLVSGNEFGYDHLKHQFDITIDVLSCGKCNKDEVVYVPKRIGYNPGFICKYIDKDTIKCQINHAVIMQ